VVYFLNILIVTAENREKGVTPTIEKVLPEEKTIQGHKQEAVMVGEIFKWYLEVGEYILSNNKTKRERYKIKGKGKSYFATDRTREASPSFCLRLSIV
jgi:hypothetical protein